jgi:hypothetical protein
MHLATSLVTDLQLLTAALVWIYAVYIAGDGYTPGAATIMVSMAAGALLANLVSVWLSWSRPCRSPSGSAAYERRRIARRAGRLRAG